MKVKHKIGLGLVLATAVVTLAGWYLHRYPIAVLQPAGEVGYKERNLIVFCASLSVAVVVPVFGMLAYFGYKYREGNKRAKYTPDVDGNRLAETIWWLIPTVLIMVISVLTWQSSYALDPYRPLASNKPTMHIQVVALDWKWLFIYPDQHVASVNYVYIPVGTPVDFEITSDTVMTSFWVPQLGGQMYAMPGMETQLNLQAAKTGQYRGVAANISGKGFASQTFTVGAVQPQLYSQSIASMRASSGRLDAASYAALAKPGTMTSPQYYSQVTPGLYDTIMMKYMMPMGSTDNTMQGMAM